MNHRKLCLLGASALALTALAGPAFAQDAEVETAGAVEEVVVTAQKRAENIQDVPLSIMAVSEKAMEAKGVDNVQDLERLIPNLRLDTIAQQAGLAVRVRGFGANSNAAIDPSVAPYIDGAFIPRPGAVLSKFLDVESVEVLRGPQGTLFGRNATVGALSVRTHAPNLSGFSAKAAAQLGNYGSQQLEGMVNMPVTDTFGVRAAVLASKTDGYTRNRLDGKLYGEGDAVVARGAAKWEITDALTWTVRTDYAHQSGDGLALNQVDTSSATPAQLAAYTARLAGNPTILQYPPSFSANQRFKNMDLKDIQYGVASDLAFEFAEGYTLRLVSAGRDWNNHQGDGDVVFTTRDLLSRDAYFDSKSHSEELQLISPNGALLNGRLDFVAGLYYFDEAYKIREVFHLGSEYCSFAVAAAAPPLVAACNAFPKANAATTNFGQDAKSVAAYLQATYKLTDTIDLILGGRQTKDEKSGAFVETLANPTAALVRAAENTALKFEDSQPSWRANLSWHATEDIMAFVTYSTGYKSGGLNSAGGAAPLGQKRLFNSETSTDWEAGVKSVLFDRRLLLNVTAYRTELDDFQERAFDGVSFTVRNAGSIRAQGFELEGQAKPTANINIDFATALLDSTFTENRNAPGLPGCNGSATSCPLVQNLTGRPPTFSPKWQASLGLEYVTDAFLDGYTASLRGDVNYTSSQYTTNDLNPQGVVAPATLFGGRFTVTSPGKDWTVALFGENLTNERTFRTKFPQILDVLFGVRNPATGATLMRGFVGAPRTVGVRLAKTF